MTEINPVTEPEVMSFAQRIVTTIVSVSQQARDIDSLRTRMENIVTEFNKLRDENDKLKSEVTEAWVFVKTVEAERDQAKRNAELGEARVAEAQGDAARAYDARNKVQAELENYAASATHTLNEKDGYISKLERELDELRSHNASLKATNEEQAFRIVKQGESLMHRQETIDRLSIELHDCAQSLNASNTKLGSVQAKLNDLRSLFDSPKEERSLLEFPQAMGDKGEVRF